MRKRGMTDYEEALKILESVEEKYESEEIELVEALGRVNARNIVSNADFPPFNRAAMDGFAFRHEDLEKMEEAVFTVKEVVLAGHFPSVDLNVGECVRIMTGAKVPHPCDTVIEFERCEEFNGKVRFLKSPPLHFNVALKGEDLKTGEIALEKGVRIAPKHVNLLASLGLEKIEVKKKIKVGVLSTGDELVDLDEKLEEGKIRNSSKYSLFSQISEIGQEFVDLGTVKDDETQIAKALEKGLNSDIVLITGGSSAGDKDFTLKVLKDMGAEVLTEKIAVKPGKPTIIARINHQGEEKWIFGMPGNPVSTFVVFKVFVTKVMEKMLGSEMSPKIFNGVLNFDFKKKGDRLHFVPCKVRVKGFPLLDDLEYNGSGDFTALSRADAFFLASKGETFLEKGRQVEFFLI